MNKIHNVKELLFEEEYLILVVDDQLVKLEYADISDKLRRATDNERRAYQISPSGYGISWASLDEDLSINGLLEAANAEGSVC